MKCTIPEISWHNREPVLSVDIHPSVGGDFYRLASGGGDCHVVIWQMVLSDNGAVKAEVISDLTRHQRAVNSVRWSPNGQYLATADDDANIIVWQLKTDNIPLLEGETNDNKEIWNVYKVLRGHKEDIYDLCWSVDGLKLLSGSVDNTAILWDLTKGKIEHILSDHKGFVQGVAWDPKDQLLATISTDRVCRIFDNTGKQVKSRIHKGVLPVSQDHYLFEKEVKFFHDDTFKSFFRRLQFSPDGNILIVPSGHVEVDDCKKITNATFIFTMDNWSEPAAVLPLSKQCSTVVRCCPILFELRDDGPEPFINLPYRMIIAVGTDHDVILYDTQQTAPFARLHEIHYTRLTDLAWSPDGLLLTASSTDGFCALITFEMDELGTPYVKEDSENEENPLNVSGCEELEKDENVDTTNKDRKELEKAKRPSFLEQWALKTPLKRKLETEQIGDLVEKSNKEEGENKVNVLQPKKIKLDNDETKAAVIEISDDENSKNEQVLQPKKLTPVKMTEAKFIAVRKSENTTRNSPKISNKSPPGGKSLSEAKPIAVRRKKQSLDGEKEQSSKSPSSRQKTPVKPIAVRKKTKEAESTSPRAKNSPLLSFLKPKNKSSSKVPNKKASSSVGLIPYVDLSLDESEARDAWEREKELKVDSTNKETSAEASSEDVTEDFCLQLEETVDSCQKLAENCDLEEKQINNEKIEINHSKEENQCSEDLKATESCSNDNKINSQKLSENCESEEEKQRNNEKIDLHTSKEEKLSGEDQKTSDSKISSNGSTSSSNDNIIKKRVPFITLESKPKITNVESNSSKTVAPVQSLKDEVPKVIKRVPLITLSSPKGKIKDKKS